MANKVSSHLYDLIYSMSGPERRYFKLYIGRHIGKSNELCSKLFDLIAKNEGKPIVKIEAKITFTEHPSRLKNYLYDLVLDSIEAYHSKSSINIKIRKQINQIEQLYSRALYKQCVSVSKKALAESEKIDNQNFKIAILSQYMSAIHQLEYKESVKLTEELLIKQQDAISKLKLEKEFLQLNNSASFLIKQPGLLDQTEIKNKLIELIDNPLLSDYSLATSYLSKVYYNRIYGVYYMFIGDVEKVNYYFKQHLLLYESYPAKKELQQDNYITCMNDYAQSCLAVGNFDMVEHYFSKMAQVIPNTGRVELKLFQYLSANRLDFYLEQVKLKQGLNLVEFIENGLRKYEKKVSMLFKIVTYHNLSYLFFATENYKQALKYNNLILNVELSSSRIDILSFAKIINLLIHYELEENISIEYFYESTERFLKGKNNIYDFELWFLHFFKSLLKQKESEKLVFFIAEEKKLLQIFTKRNERRMIEYFNILAWIRTKIDSISFEESLKEYSQKEYQEYLSFRS